MSVQRLFVAALCLGGMLVTSRCASAADPPLAEAAIISLIELQIDDEAIVARVRKAGLAFAPDDVALKRLAGAGASDAVLAAVREAVAAKNRPATSLPLTYEDVLDLLSLGVEEQAILRRHAKSPSALTFDVNQMSKLKQAGASPKLLAALSADAGAAGADPADQPAATKPSVAKENTIPGWGEFVDPVGDCKFRRDDAGVTITVPGTEHNLWPLKGEVNAPLVLQEATGDFTVEVLVSSVGQAETGTVLPGLASATAFHSGTLVIWQDPMNFVRLDRTDMNKSGQGITSCYLHIFHDGERVVELAELVKDTPTHLRLQRRGDQLTAAYSQNGGQNWRSFPVQKIGLANKVRTGVSALNATSRACEVRFEAIKLKN